MDASQIIMTDPARVLVSQGEWICELPGTAGEVLHLGADAGEPALVAVGDDGRDEACGGRHSHADVHTAVQRRGRLLAAQHRGRGGRSAAAGSRGERERAAPRSGHM